MTILKSQSNFRDLGGVITKSGLRVKEKRIFRSGFLAKLNENERVLMEDLKIDTILDLRTPQEIDLVGKGSYPVSIRYQNIALDAGNISKSLIPIFQKGNFHLLEADLLNSIYFDLITKFNTELATIFRAIINSDKAIVYHCSHGKDRTGIISALLLDFFEVDREFIYTDYLRSNARLKASNAHQIQQIKDNFTKIFKRAVSNEEFAPVEALFYCHESNLKAVFDYVDTEYGSVKNYFMRALGLSQEELELLNHNYLA